MATDQTTEQILKSLSDAFTKAVEDATSKLSDIETRIEPQLPVLTAETPKASLNFSPNLNNNFDSLLVKQKFLEKVSEKNNIKQMTVNRTKRDKVKKAIDDEKLNGGGIGFKSVKNEDGNTILTV